MTGAQYSRIPEGKDSSCMPVVCSGSKSDAAQQPSTSKTHLIPLGIGTSDLEGLANGIQKNPYSAVKGCIEAGFPLIHNVWTRYSVIAVYLEPYRLGLLRDAAFGLILCFFGGSYMTLIAAVEAYRMCGWETQLKLINELIEDFQIFLAASAEDDKEDLDKNGIADVNEIDAKGLAQRKALVFFRSIDPQRFGEVIGGLQTGFFAVIATLKLEFARAVTLGTVIGQMLKKPVDTYITPIFLERTPAEYKKWPPVVMGWVVKAITIYIAFTVQRIISAYYSAIRGGRMFAYNVLFYLEKMGWLGHVNVEESIIDEVIGYTIAGLGLYWQLSAGFSVPFPLNIVLLPASVAEWYLLWCINDGTAAVSK